MSDVTSAAKLPERFDWHGIWFKRVAPRHDDRQRFESEDGQMGIKRGVWVYENKVGQWIAKFEPGCYSIEWSLEEALTSAAWNAIGMLRSDLNELHSMVLPLEEP